MLIVILLPAPVAIALDLGALEIVVVCWRLIILVVGWRFLVSVRLLAPLCSLGARTLLLEMLDETRD